MSSALTLNPQQQLAASYGETLISGGAAAGVNSGPLLIIAGAGTGKTNTLAYRAAHLIINGVAPERILLMTFSRRAATELVSRTGRIVSSRLQRPERPPAALSGKAAVRIPWMGTFHSIASRLLRIHADAVGLEPGFTIMDRADGADLMDLLRQELGFSRAQKRFPKKATCLDIYSRRINSQLPLEQVLASDFPWCAEWQSELTELFRLYTRRKLEQVCLDYDDLLLYWYLMVEEPAIAASIRQRFDHVLVDEYQDTNVLQDGILRRLFPEGRGLTVVGDDAQSIYGFRCAEVDNILQFPEQFSPQAKVITLEQNYRSSQPLLDAANALLADGRSGYRKQLFSDRSGGRRPQLVSVEDMAGQSEYIVEKILAEREAGTCLKEQAVLFRSAHHSDHLELELARHDIPFVKYGGLKFLEAAHVKDVLALLRWGDNPKHRISGFRILKLLPGIGPGIATKALDFLELHHFDPHRLADFRAPAACSELWQGLVALLVAVHHDQLPWSSQMERVCRWYAELLELNYEDHFVRHGDVEQLAQISQRYSSRERFLSELTLDPPAATGDLAGKPHRDDDFLILSTVHSAKGQEWKNVFLLNVADGNFPNEYAAGDDKQLEEERRLLYVAMTRAKQNLDLIQPLKYWVPEQQKYGSRHVYGAKSRFLTPAVCAQLDACCYPPPPQISESNRAANRKAITDIRSKLDELW